MFRMEPSENRTEYNRLEDVFDNSQQNPAGDAEIQISQENSESNNSFRTAHFKDSPT